MKLATSVVYLKNRSSTSAVSTIPYEAWHGHGIRPDLSHLRILGSTAYVHIPKEKRAKLDLHSHKGILVGYGGTNQYRVWDLTRKDVVVSRDVKFNEDISAMDRPVAIPEEPRISTTTSIAEAPRTIYDSITVLSGPPDDNSESESEISIRIDEEPAAVDPQVLLQATEPVQRISA